MDKRNPSRCAKSEKEKQWLQRQLKKVSSENTAPIETPFEPSNKISDDNTPKKSTKKRPKPLLRRITAHISENSATYITCGIALVVALVFVPIFNLNRDVGESKIEINSVKKSLDTLDSSFESRINNETSRLDNEIKALEQGSASLENKMQGLSEQISSMKTYLVNKFKAIF